MPVSFRFLNSFDLHINWDTETLFYTHFVVEETKFRAASVSKLSKGSYLSKELGFMLPKLQTAFYPMTVSWLQARQAPAPGSHQLVSG